jgi:hypothetical protein
VTLVEPAQVVRCIVLHSVFPDAAASEEFTGSIPTLFLKHGVMHLD